MRMERAVRSLFRDSRRQCGHDRGIAQASKMNAMVNALEQRFPGKAAA
jgi:hypothetical protein